MIFIVSSHYSIQSYYKIKRKGEIKKMEKQKMLYVCFGHTLSWSDIEKTHLDLVDYLKSNYDLTLLDYQDEDPDKFDSKLDLKEKSADVIIHDITNSAWANSDELPCSIGERFRWDKPLYTITGNLDSQTIIDFLKKR